MNLEDLRMNLEKLQPNGLEFELTHGATEEEVQEIQKSLDLVIPEGTIEFFKSHNGMETRNPNLKILSIKDWKLTTKGLIHFATFNEEVDVFFEPSELNSTNQWTIIHPDSNYEITKSMSSFWSNKIWHWLKKRRHIWQDEYWVE